MLECSDPRSVFSGFRLHHPLAPVCKRVARVQVRTAHTIRAESAAESRRFGSRRRAVYAPMPSANFSTASTCRELQISDSKIGRAAATKKKKKAEVRRSFDTTTVREQHLRSQHKGATDANATGGKGRVRTGDRRHPVLCLCQLTMTRHPSCPAWGSMAQRRRGGGVPRAGRCRTNRLRRPARCDGLSGIRFGPSCGVRAALNHIQSEDVVANGIGPACTCFRTGGRREQRRE